jgi:hypothetical protein
LGEFPIKVNRKLKVVVHACNLSTQRNLARPCLKKKKKSIENDKNIIRHECENLLRIRIEIRDSDPFLFFYHFYIYLHVYTVFVPPPPTLPNPPPHPWVAGRTCSTLFSDFVGRENLRDNKDIAFC